MSFTEYPQQLGKYRINAQLGQGAMGVVYHAFDTEIDREVAIKILHIHLLTSEMGNELVRRFNNEVKAAARCQHPNIVTIYDYGISKNQPYMVMEYVKGIDLQMLLKSGQLLSAEQAINLILKVLDALANAHAMGIVHRDIKPANIMLLDNGQVKVTDFGVAHIDSSDLTQLGDVMGTPSYMSPEAYAGAAVTISSDLYATALVLLELLINKRVKAKEINYAFLYSELSAQNLTQQLVKNITDVLNKALQYQPEQRYVDAVAFSHALSACLETNTSHYQLANDLATTVLMIKNTFPLTATQENTDSLFTAATSSLLLQGQLSEIEKNLTYYLGPVAKMLLKKQVKNTANLPQLIHALATHISSEIDRKNFINTFNFSTNTNNSELLGKHLVPPVSDKVTESLFSTEYIEQLTTDLTAYLGPVAKHLIKSMLKKVNSQEELCISLAEKIPTLKERTEFLKKRR